MEQETQLANRPLAAPPGLGLRKIVAVPFRRRRLVLWSFLATVFGLTIGIFLLPPDYLAEMKILLKRDREISVVSPGSDPQTRVNNEMTDQDVNSEVDMLSSRELEQKVVVALKLQDQKLPLFKAWKALLAHTEEEKIALATQNLDDNLRVTPPNQSNLISVTYQASDAQQSAAVLNTLARFYLEKHLEVHKLPGTFAFFGREAERYRKELEEAKRRLSDFNQHSGVVEAQMEKQNTLQKLSAFEGTQQETVEAIAATQERLRDLKRQAKMTPRRVTTQVRTPSMLLEQLNTTLFTLESKRTELLQKFEPTYRTVTDVEQQIAATRAAIAGAEKRPLTEPTTDENPIYAWATSELAKEQSHLAALRARQSATARTIDGYRKQAMQLDQAGLQQQSLLQAVKTTEDNYLLALKKQEEARTSDELDKQRIANVAIAEAAVAPPLPASSTLLRLVLAVMLAGVFSIGCAFVSDVFDPSFRTRAEAESLLHAPVLAILPPLQEAQGTENSRGFRNNASEV